MPNRDVFTVCKLRVDACESPLGITEAWPRLSWQVVSAERAAVQAAYRISAASSRALLASDRPDLWDSEWQLSDSTIDIPYAGTPLRSREQVYWRVQSRDANGIRAQADAHWEMGLLSKEDWSAPWIAIEGDADRDDRDAAPRWTWGDLARHEPNRKFRFRLSLSKDAQATLMIGGRDRLDGLWIDGQRYPTLSPAPIDFVAPPLTELSLRLEAGDHVIAAEVSFNPHLVFPSATGKFCGLIRLEYADGQIQRLATPEGWKTALEESSDWATPAFDDSTWADVQVIDEQPNMPWPARAAMLVRKEFSVAPGLRSARLYATALGAYEPLINGHVLDDAMLSPGYTDYGKKTPYRVLDVTGALRTGDNAMGFLVGDGWFASACAPMSRFPFTAAPRRLCAQLELLYEDGRTETVTTDGSWQLREGPVVRSEIYNGELYDARLEVPGWSEAGAAQAGWTTAQLAEPAPGPLVADCSAPVRVVEVLAPVSVVTLEPGRYLFDFGQNCAAVPRLRVTAPRGTRISMRFSEILKDGRIDQSNLRAARAEDIYICRGDADGEMYQPHFTFHGYRYAEVECPPTVQRPGLETAVVHSDLPIISTFETQEEVVQGIWRNARWSQRSNFVGIPTDCPQRDERLGWTGDALVFWDAATLHMDVEGFTRRFLSEVRSAQQDDGTYPVFAPTPWRMPEGIGPTPGWADAGVFLPWVTWQRSGSTSVIRDNWQAMTRYLQLIEEHNPEMLWLRKRGADFGDWLAVDSKTPGDATTPKDLIATSLWAFDCSMMIDMAEACGLQQEADRWRSTRTSIVAAFKKAYVSADGTIGNGSQTSYILPLYFGLLDEQERGPAAARLAANIRERGIMLTTGFLGTPFALHVLADTGHGDLGVALLRRTDYPSWGYMLRKGATTMWERWNSDTSGVQMNSHNHYAFGAVSSFLMRRVAGIDSAAPGYRRIRIRPVYSRDLGKVSGSLQSPVGLISTSWHMTRDTLELQLTVPANAIAEVHVIGGGITESAIAIEGRKDLRIVAKDVGMTILEVGSGEYSFRSKVMDAMH